MTNVSLGENNKTKLLLDGGRPGANPLKLLRLKIKSELFKFSKISHMKHLYVELLVGITLKL